jgi:hypothetical protein
MRAKKTINILRGIRGNEMHYGLSVGFAMEVIKRALIYENSQIFGNKRKSFMM